MHCHVVPDINHREWGYRTRRCEQSPRSRPLVHTKRTGAIFFFKIRFYAWTMRLSRRPQCDNPQYPHNKHHTAAGHVRAGVVARGRGRAGIGVPVARTRRRTFIHGASSSAPTSVHAGRICAARVAAARIEYTSAYFKVGRAWCSAHVLRRLLVSRRSAALAYRPGFAAVAPEGQA